MDDHRGDFKRRFAASLLGLRADKGIRSQKELGQLVGVSTATAQRWEDLELPHLPDAWELARLCDVLDCEPDELVRPRELSERERQLARRAVRAVGRAVDRGRAAS